MVYEFSDLTLDLDRRELTRDGEPVKLTKLSFKVLEVLVQAAPALVSHDDLIDRVWGPNRVITPDNLAQRMKTLRQSLGDTPDEPRYVEGVRGEGYRLVPEVSIQPSTANGDAPTQAKRWGLYATVTVVLLAVLGWFAIGWMDRADTNAIASSEDSLAPVAAEPQRTRQPAIAVLPFANLSANSSNQFFADGIHDDLITRISNIRDIKTISRTSVMAYRGSDKKLQTIAGELGVTTILEGGVQRSGDQVRINLQLIDAETDAHLWAQTYTRALSAADVFAVQAEITEAVAGALKAVLSNDERQQFGKLPTANLQALDAYYLGKQYVAEHTSESIKQAIAAYQQAVELDPEFSAAFSNLALAMLGQVWLGGVSRRDQLEKSRPIIDQAILLDPQSTIAFTALGKWYDMAGDDEKAEQAYQQALKFGPNNTEALANYGNLKQWEFNDPAAAVALFRKAVEVDPRNIGRKIQLADVLGKTGQGSEAIALMEVLVTNHPESSGAHRVLGELYSSSEFRNVKAMKHLRLAYDLDPGHPGNSFNIANMYYRLGDLENSVLWLNHAAKLAPESEVAPDFLGWAYLNSGKYEDAREQFDRSGTDGDLHWSGVFMLARIDVAEGHPDRALRRYLEFADNFDGRKSFINFNYGTGAIAAYQQLGEHENAQALIDTLMSVIETDPPMSYDGVQVLDAALYTVSGQTEAAIATLSEWVSEGGASARLQILTQYELSVLLDDPRYQDLLQTVNTRLAEQRANLVRWESNGEIPPIPRVVTDPR